MNETTPTPTAEKKFDPLEPYGYPNTPANKTRRFTCKCQLKPCCKKWTEDVEYKFSHWSLDYAGRHLPNWIPVNRSTSRCPFCKTIFITSKPIKGHYSADHKCDKRCENATGQLCECQCGGENHGKAHLIAA